MLPLLDEGIRSIRQPCLMKSMMSKGVPERSGGAHQCLHIDFLCDNAGFKAELAARLFLGSRPGGFM
jgi:hypothetical protein